MIIGPSLLVSINQEVMAFNVLPGGALTLSSFDYDFIVTDDIYTMDPSADTTAKLGKAINTWTNQETELINSFQEQMQCVTEMKKRRAERFDKKLRTVALQIIQRVYRNRK